MQEVNIDRLTLSNAGGGTLEEQFQKCLGDLLAVQDRREEYETDKDAIAFKITAELTIKVNQDGSGTVSVQCNGKGPKRKSRKQSLNVINDKMMVFNAPIPEQMPLPGKIANIN